MQRHIGTILLTGSAVAYSLCGFFVRLIPLDVMTLLFWRSVFGGLTVAVLILVQHRGASWRIARDMGWIGVAAAVIGSTATLLYLAAFRFSSVADVSVIYALLPLVAAGLGWVLLRERPGWRALAASLVALAGVAIMSGGAVGAGAVTGDLLALGMTLLFGLLMVLMRRARGASMMPAMALSCLLDAAVAWPFARTGPIVGLPMGELALFGGQLGLGLILLTLGMRHVTTTRAALIGLLDVPLAPVWVWLAFNEVPPGLTLIGGAIILAAVVWNIAGAAHQAGPVLRRPEGVIDAVGAVRLEHQRPG